VTLQEIGQVGKLFGLSPNRTKLLADRKLLGKWGEKRCEKFLRGKGLKKITGNFSCKTGEIDLVMADTGGEIVFVEVKTRTDENFGPAEASITAVKKNRMYKAARYFLAVHNITERIYRFDVVTIILGRSGPILINHYPNAFVP